MKKTASLFLGWLFTVCALAGCGKQPANAPGASGAGVVESGYVDVNRLAARHPLQKDVRRLAEAERRLGLLAARPTNAPGSDAEGYILPALMAGGGTESASESASRNAFARRRSDARRQLVRETDQQLGALARELDERRERRRAQRRASLEAVGRAQQQERERVIRENVTIRIRSLLEMQSLERSNLRVKRGALESDLALDWVLGSADIEAEIKRLNAEPLVAGISDRARLERARRQVEADLADRRGQADAVQSAGVREAAIAIAEARAEAAEGIERRLALELNGDRAQELISGQRKERADALALEARSSARALAEAEQLRRAQLNGAVAGPFAVATFAPEAGALNMRDALARIGAQRRRLLAFITTDIRESVRDAALKHHVVVELRDNGSPSKFGEPVLGTNLTDRFADWVLPVEATRGGAPAAATRAAGG